jgi:hypothetical protein
MTSKVKFLYRHEQNQISRGDFIKKLCKTKSGVDFLNTLLDGVNNYVIDGKDYKLEGF